MEEIWKDIPGFEGLYQISNLGRVKSLPKMAGRRFQDEHMIALVDVSGGYVGVQLYKNGKGKRYSLHRLVATSFIDNPENFPQVNHVDGNKKNNCVTNLEWCTAKENIRHAWDTGLHPHYSGEKAPMYGKRLSEEAKEKISKHSLEMWRKRKSGVK